MSQYRKFFVLRWMLHDTHYEHGEWRGVKGFHLGFQDARMRPSGCASFPSSSGAEVVHSAERLGKRGLMVTQSFR